MEEEQLRDLALEMLSNLESWIRHSDEYQRLFSSDDINDDAALSVVEWTKKRAEKSERGA